MAKPLSHAARRNFSASTIVSKNKELARAALNNWPENSRADAPYYTEQSTLVGDTPEVIGFEIGQLQYDKV